MYLTERVYNYKLMIILTVQLGGKQLLAVLHCNVIFKKRIQQSIYPIFRPISTYIVSTSNIPSHFNIYSLYIQYSVPFQHIQSLLQYSVPFQHIQSLNPIFRPITTYIVSTSNIPSHFNIYSLYIQYTVPFQHIQSLHPIFRPISTYMVSISNIPIISTYIVSTYNIPSHFNIYSLYIQYSVPFQHLQSLHSIFRPISTYIVSTSNILSHFNISECSSKVLQKLRIPWFNLIDFGGEGGVNPPSVILPLEMKWECDTFPQLNFSRPALSLMVMVQGRIF